MTTRQHALIPRLGFPVLLALLAVQGLVGAHAAGAQSSSDADEDTLVGTWRVEVQLTDCDTGKPTGEPGPALFSYVPGGVVLVASTPVAEPAQGTLLSSGQGIWEQTGERRFRSFFILFLFNPDGSLAGSFEVRNADTKLAKDSDTFTEPDSRARILDVDGEVIATACAALTGRRLTFDQ